MAYQTGMGPIDLIAKCAGKRGASRATTLFQKPAETRIQARLVLLIVSVPRRPLQQI